MRPLLGLLVPLLLLALGAPERFRRVEAGTRLRAEPDASSLSVAVVDADVDLEVLEERSGWVRVRYEAVKGWLRPDAPDAGAAALLSAPRETPDAREGAARAARARSLLGKGARAASAGPFCLETDVRDARLRERALRVAAELEAVYRERTGLRREYAGEGTVVVFERRAAYGAFEAADAPPGGAPRAGHALQGVAALSAEGPPDDVLAVLVHELTHLLSHGVLRRALPPWLEEGLAEDLAWCQLDGRGRPVPDTFRRSRTTIAPALPMGGLLVLERSSTTASVERFLSRRRSGERVPTVRELLRLPAEDFERPDTQAAAYASSGLFVRFLSASSPGAGGLRALLDSAADGEPLSEEALHSVVGQDDDGLQAAFDAWLSRLRRF